MTTEVRFQRLKQSSVKGAKVAAIVATLAFLTGASPLRALALGAAIEMFFVLPSGLIILSDFFAGRSLDTFSENTGDAGISSVV